MTRLDPVPSRPWDADVRIWRDGISIAPCGASVPWTVIWHSPDGWNFGYAGSGPADLALNILNAFVPPRVLSEDELETDEEFVEGETDPVRCYQGVCSRFAARWHQDFKWEFIAPLQAPGGTLAAEMIKSWIESRRQRQEKESSSAIGTASISSDAL